jgi:hypothetical protein
MRRRGAPLVGRAALVDARRVVVVGVSRGCTAALHAALEQYRAPPRATDVRFTVYVAIATRVFSRAGPR